MRNIDDYRKHSGFCEEVSEMICDLSDTQQRLILELVRNDFPVDETKGESNQLMNFIVSCKSADYIHYHQDGRMDPVVPYFLDNFNEIKALIHGELGIDSRVD